jgi:hypothetical protein
MLLGILANVLRNPLLGKGNLPDRKSTEHEATSELDCLSKKKLPSDSSCFDFFNE